MCSPSSGGMDSNNSLDSNPALDAEGSPDPSTASRGLDERSPSPVGPVGPTSTSSFTSMEALPFGPTAMEAWLRCPAYWHYSNHWSEVGWRPHMLMGRAMDEGCNTVLRGGSEGEGRAAALSLLEAEYQETERWPLDDLRRRLNVGLTKAWTTQLVWDDEEVMLVDVPIGHARPDLVLRNRVTRTYRVVDRKTTLTLPYDTPARLRSYELTQQAYYYPALIQQVFGAPVSEFGIHLLILDSRVTRSCYHGWDIDQDALTRWVLEAPVIQGLMSISKATGVPLWHNTNSCFHFDYGRCPFFDGCHGLVDESSFDTLYQPKEL